MPVQRLRAVLTFVASFLAITAGIANGSPVRGQSLYADDGAYRTQFRERCELASETMAHQSWDPVVEKDSRRRIYLGVVKLANGIDAATAG